MASSQRMMRIASGREAFVRAREFVTSPASGEVSRWLHVLYTRCGKGSSLSEPAQRKTESALDTRALDRTIQSFAGFVGSLPAAKLRPSTSKSWGPREVLIHFVFWHEQCAQIASAIAYNKEPVLLKGTGRALNDAAVVREIDTPVDQLLQRWTRAPTCFSAVARSSRASEIRMSLRVGAKGLPTYRSHPSD